MILASLGRAYPRKHPFFNKKHNMVKRVIELSLVRVELSLVRVELNGRDWVELSLVRDFREITKIQLFSHFFWKKHFRNERYWADFKNIFFEFTIQTSYFLRKTENCSLKKLFFCDCDRLRTWKTGYLGFCELKNTWFGGFATDYRHKKICEFELFLHLNPLHEP